MVNLFLDTDFGPDCDDVGALQLLHTFCDMGEARLIGVTHCTSNPCGLPAISALNRFNGREVPLGTTMKQGFLADTQKYNRAMTEQYPHEFVDGRPQRNAVEVFREVMAAQEDASVTLCAIGPLNNLADFLADDECRALIERKVKKLVSMAGRFADDSKIPTPGAPEGHGVAEWNVEQDVAAMQKVMNEWPTPVVLCPWECGRAVMTGGFLQETEPNPVELAYRLWTDGRMERASYDLLAAYFAVRGEDELMCLSPAGRIEVSEDGVTVLIPDLEGRHAYTVNTLPGDGCKAG